MPISPVSARERFDARRAAEAYAPSPKSSVAMYGLAGLVLAAVAVAGLGAFYGLTVAGVLLPLVAAAAAGIAGGVGLYLVRRQRHAAAVSREHALMTDPLPARLAARR